MKKKIVLFSSIVFMFCLYVNGQSDIGYRLQFFPYNFYEWKEDVNSDYIVDTQDVLRIYESIQTADNIDKVSDVNQDNVVDTQDVLKVYEYIQTGSSPTLLAPTDPAIDVITTAIELLDYHAIVRWPLCDFSLIVPTDNGLLTYIDPVSLGRQNTQIWKFMMNPHPNRSNSFSRIQAVVYNAEKQFDGSWLPTDSLMTYVGSSSTDRVFDKLQDIIENCIIAEHFVSGKQYYKTISGNYIRVNGDINNVSDMTISGGFQVDENNPSRIVKVGKMMNGKAYVVDKAVYSSYKSVSDVLINYPEFSEFYGLLQACGALATSTGSRLFWSSTSKNGNLIYIPDNRAESVDYLLNTYNYTIYVPTNAAMDEAYDKGLPTMEMTDKAIEIDDTYGTDSAAHLRKVMLDFVKYHIQENSIFIDKGFEIGKYASMKLNENGVPYKIILFPSPDNLEVQDACSNRQTIYKNKMSNIMAREYWLNNRNAESATLIETSSSVVLHAIDHPLLYKYREGADLTLPENNQFIYDPKVLKLKSNY